MHRTPADQLWQDVARDYQMGRIYIPLEDMERFDYTEDELAQGLATESFRALMKFEVDRSTRPIPARTGPRKHS